jgi:hypothetical protein
MSGGFTPVRPLRVSAEVVLQLEDAIMEAHLELGDRLPPERELADASGSAVARFKRHCGYSSRSGSSRRGKGSASGSVPTAHQNRIATLLALRASIRRVPMADLDAEVMGLIAPADAEGAAATLTAHMDGFFKGPGRH